MRILYLGWDDKAWRGSLVKGLREAGMEVLTSYVDSKLRNVCGKYIGGLGFVLNSFQKSSRSNVVLGDYASDMGYLATIIGRLLRKPVAVYARGGEVDTRDPDFSDNVSIRRIKHTLANASVTLCVSQYLVDRVLELCPKANVRLVYNGVDTQRFFPKKSKLRFRLLEVAYLSKRKGIETILKAMPLIVEEFPQTHLTIVGGDPTGYKEKLSQLSRELNIDRHVTFTGYVSDKALPGVYRAHDIFVHTPYSEQFGVVLIEAMASGLPVVATSTGGIPEIVPSHYLVPIKNHEKLAKKICGILNSSDQERWNIGMENRELVINKFTVRQQALGVIRAITEAIAANPFSLGLTNQKIQLDIG